MSHEELEMLKARWAARTDFLKALFSGFKDLGLVAASVATIWIQSGNAAKLDATAAKTEVVESKIEQTAVQHDQKLAAIAQATDASVKGWKAYQTKDPDDMNEAAQAVAAAERTAESAPVK